MKHVLVIIGRSLLIAIAVLFILVSIGGIVGTWYANRVATDVTLKVFSVVESGVSIGESGVGQALTKVRDSRAEIAQTETDIKTLSTNIKENHPALTALSERVDAQLAPGIEKIENTLAPVREGLIAVDATLTIANSIPYVRENAPELQQVQDAMENLSNLRADVQQLRATLRAEAEGQADELTEQTTQLLLDIAGRVDVRLAKIQTDLETVQSEIDALSQRIAQRKSKLLFILNLTAVLLTLVFVWLIYTQIVVIGAQVRKLRGEPKCPECPEVEGAVPLPAAPAAAVTAPVASSAPPAPTADVSPANDADSAASSNTGASPDVVTDAGSVSSEETQSSNSD